MIEVRFRQSAIVDYRAVCFGLLRGLSWYHFILFMSKINIFCLLKKFFLFLIRCINSIYSSIYINIALL